MSWRAFGILDLPRIDADRRRTRHGRVAALVIRQVIERVEVLNQKGDVALVADHIYIVERWPPAA